MDDNLSFAGRERRPAASPTRASLPDCHASAAVGERLLPAPIITSTNSAPARWRPRSADPPSQAPLQARARSDPARCLPEQPQPGASAPGRARQPDRHARGQKGRAGLERRRQSTAHIRHLQRACRQHPKGHRPNGASVRYESAEVVAGDGERPAQSQLCLGGSPCQPNVLLECAGGGFMLRRLSLRPGSIIQVRFYRLRWP